MVLPKPVYEMLPYGYLVIALLTYALLESGVRYLSGTVFLAAGLMVLYWRMHYRSTQKATARSRRKPAGRAPVRHRAQSGA